MSTPRPPLVGDIALKEDSSQTVADVGFRFENGLWQSTATDDGWVFVRPKYKVGDTIVHNYGSYECQYTVTAFGLVGSTPTYQYERPHLYDFINNVDNSRHYHLLVKAKYVINDIICWQNNPQEFFQVTEVREDGSYRIRGLVSGMGYTESASIDSHTLLQARAVS